MDASARVAPSGVTLPRVREMLWSLGLSPRLVGCTYLTAAILWTSRDIRLGKNLTETLYPMVGARFGVDGRTVERCMRRSIEAAWSTGAFIAQRDLFGESIDEQRGKPTCGELIVRVTDFLRLKEWKDI
jgi:two-component system response regulator (stage 0 sporulation protein A)